MRCPSCNQEELHESVGSIKYIESGLPNITIKGLKLQRCNACGEELVSIPNMPGLHKAIANFLIQKSAKLATNEIIFLRKYLGWSQQEFAKKIGVKPETIVKWENGRSKIHMSRQNELLFRSLVALGEKIDNYRDHIEEFASVDTIDSPPLSFLYKKTWHQETHIS